MHDIQPQQIKTGGDPRTLSDFTALREELGKLTHPARPDVDWRRVEALSLSLFRQNGVELQTTAWFTLARAHLAGISGLNEGLAILEALIAHRWGVLWPQPVHARMEILASLCHRLQSVLRTLSLSGKDLAQVLQAEQHLSGLRDVLQRLELKNAGQIGELCAFMHNAAVRLENTEAAQREEMPVVVPATATAAAAVYSTEPAEPLVYVVHQEAAPSPDAPEPQAPPKQWRGFVTGVLTTLIVAGAAAWGWHAVHPAAAEPLPVAASEQALKTLEQQSPLWLVDYGFTLAAGAKPPADAGQLKAQWQRYIEGNALPPEGLSGWHQGMEQLTKLANQLNGLDEKRGKYMTVSELKSIVFSATQSFNRSVPLEEQLYLYSRGENAGPLSLTQTDRHFNQLLNRYWLIKQEVDGQ